MKKKQNREIPMLFSTNMVQALLAGTKTETRRTGGLKEINQNPFPDAWKFVSIPNDKARGYTGSHGDIFNIDNNLKENYMNNNEKSETPLMDLAPKMIATVIKCQNILAAYIVPDSGISDHDVIGSLLEALDNQELVKSMKEAGI